MDGHLGGHRCSKVGVVMAAYSMGSLLGTLWGIHMVLCMGPVVTTQKCGTAKQAGPVGVVGTSVCAKLQKVQESFSHMHHTVCSALSLCCHSRSSCADMVTTSGLSSWGDHPAPTVADTQMPSGPSVQRPPWHSTALARGSSGVIRTKQPLLPLTNLTLLRQITHTRSYMTYAFGINARTLSTFIDSGVVLTTSPHPLPSHTLPSGL